MRVESVTISKFADEIRKLGAKSVYECFNCGNCTAVCPLADNNYIFPRKVVRYIQLGQGEKVKASPEIWLCHGCGECSATCPRKAYPSELMNAARNYAIKEFAFPKIVAKLFESPVYLPVLFAIPALLLFLFLYIIGFPEYPQGEVHFSEYIHPLYIEFAGIIAGTYVLLSVLVGLKRFSKAIMPQRSFFRNFIDAVIMILKHTRFGECETNSFRKYAHMMVFYGFILLGFSTLGALIYLDFLDRELSLPLTDPVKIVGNAGAVLLVLGSIWIIYERISKRNEIGSMPYSDWFFVTMLFLVSISGLSLEALRFLQSVAAYPMYLLHLIFVFNLLIYAPYSKFAHLIYRGMTYVYVEVNRDGKVENLT